MIKNKERTSIIIASLISYLTFAINILVTIFYTPFMLEQLGDVEYGIRSFALAFSNFTSLLGLGISSSYLRFANLALKNDGQDGVKRINGIFFKIYSIIGAIAILMGGVLVLFLSTGIIPLNNYSSEEQKTILLIVAFSFLQSGITFATCVFPLSIVFKKKFIFRNTMFLLTTVITHAIWIVLLLGGYKSVALSVAGLIIECLFHLINIFYMIFGLKERIDLKGHLNDKKLLGEILFFSLFSFLVTVTTTLNSSVDKIILGFLDNSETTYVTTYSLSVVFNAYLVTAASTISVLFDPSINESVVNGEFDSVQKTFNVVSFICTFLLSFIVFGFISCGQTFICSWIGNENSIVYFFSLPIMFCNIFIYPQTFSLQIQRANNKHKFSAIIYASSFVLNIGLSIVLCLIFNTVDISPIWGCIVGTVVSYILETIGMSVYNSKVLNLKQGKMWFQTALNIIIGAVAAGLVFLIKLLIPNSFYNDLTYLIQTILLGCVFVVLYIALQLMINIKNLKSFYKAFKSRKANKKQQVEVEEKEKEAVVE